MAETVAAHIKTRFLVLSDTHGLDSLPDSVSRQYADVAIHCGDLTTESKIDEYKASIRFLQALNAPLKLVIAGNHDFTMDIPVFQRKVAEVRPPLDPRLLEQAYGYYGEVRQLFTDTTGITFLDEGTHSFRLQNGALLNVYASPNTPSLGDWGFQYHPDHGHDFSIHNVDVAVTHGPSKGIMDYTYSGQRAGCPYLFEAIARARPRMHCFGHIHEGWGAKLVTWRRDISKRPSHLTDIDNEKSVLIDRLSTLRPSMEFSTTSHCSGDPNPLKWGSQTLFVNAAIQGTEDLPIQPPWLVDLELPPANT
ncbi:hypothetical protein PENDEC_c035G04348 [Penicillium decumbens]|uniref:Calcineurin-like phosphoesterase domain-containing protein n=1 Tax=Penicillium decumbens TaxID=69771 RepID=A0A1V6NUY5_PENDC|nr:hypothetical protein PENDEC_c035G04348 [Penicillium decumbens]